MFDEEEHARMARLHLDPILRFKVSPASRGQPLSEQLAPALVDEEVERLTGFPRMDAATLAHHRLSLYGPPCTKCGKPLRTPEARHCAACGTPR